MFETMYSDLCLYDDNVSMFCFKVFVIVTLTKKLIAKYFIMKFYLKRIEVDLGLVYSRVAKQQAMFASLYKTLTENLHPIITSC